MNCLSMTYVEFLKSLGWVLVSKLSSRGKALETQADTTKKNKDVDVVVLENLYNPVDKWEIWEKVKPVVSPYKNIGGMALPISKGQ